MFEVELASIVELCDRCNFVEHSVQGNRFNDSAIADQDIVNGIKHMIFRLIGMGRLCLEFDKRFDTRWHVFCSLVL